ncbi:MAG: extracellular solute-binding protein [Euzebyales bacterium]|nr:extracellular solute-binding protein [Euzebyales bacterium]
MRQWMSRWAWLVVVVVVAAGCGGEQGARAPTPSDTPAGQAAAPSRTLRLYTTVTEDTVDAVVAAYGEEHPDVAVEVFRAPTGELNARIAAERREGEVRADVLWLTDPLSMQGYDAEGLLAAVPGDAAAEVAREYRSDTSVGTRILDMVIVHEAGLDPAPRSWRDLADPAYADAVALPDPAFAGSALGVLGYFADAEGYGLDFYRDLAANGAVTVPAPDEVVTGVAEGRFRAGMTLGTAARAAAEQGSPIEIVQPSPGAIAIYSPIAVVRSARDRAAAASFVEFSVTRPAQEAIADTGWQPIRDDVPWAHDSRLVAPDWPAVADRQAELLDAYRSIFGG